MNRKASQANPTLLSTINSPIFWKMKKKSDSYPIKSRQIVDGAEIN
jgi:hypothetical protein